MSFLATLPPDGPAREAHILAALPSLPPPTWVPVTLGPITFYASIDCVCERAPMAAPTAQAVADFFGAVLPTPEMVEAIEDAARAVDGLVAFDPWPRWQDDSQLHTATILWREENIARRLAGRTPSIIAGHLKNPVLAPFMPPGRVVIFGGLTVAGRRVQPLYPVPGGGAGHGADFGGGYAHGTRLVRADCLVNGRPSTVGAALAAGLLGGPVAATRYPTSSVPAPTGPRILRRGMTGEDVRELQRLLTAAGWFTTADAVFGALTEAAVRTFQGDAGLTQDGLAGPRTMQALRKTSPDQKDSSASVPFVQARNFRTGRLRPIRAVVLHTMEAAEKPGTAEAVAHWFAGAAAPMASAHFAVDSDSVVQCVREQDTAFAAPGLNADGIQIEMAGYAGQGSAGWADPYSRAMLARVARLVADLCRRHALPVAFVDAAGLLRGEEGITTHAEVTKAYRQSTHTDPGPTFPMADFLAAVLAS